jgi:hypothetical protein
MPDDRRSASSPSASSGLSAMRSLVAGVGVAIARR